MVKFLRAKWKPEDEAITRRVLLDIEDVRQIFLYEAEGEKFAEIYFKAPIAIDKKSEVLYDWIKIELADAEKLLKLLDDNDLILKPKKNEV